MFCMGFVFVFNYMFVLYFYCSVFANTIYTYSLVYFIFISDFLCDTYLGVEYL